MAGVGTKPSFEGVKPCFTTCSSCGMNTLCMFIITGCRSMHITEWYICKTCWDKQQYCSVCAAYVIEWAALGSTVDGFEWYTSWGGPK